MLALARWPLDHREAIAIGSEETAETTLHLGAALPRQGRTTASEAVVKLEKTSNNGFNIALDSDKDVYGLQFDVVCDSKISTQEVTHAFADNDLRSNMSVYSRLRDDGSVRVIMFDMTGKSIVTANNVENVIAMTLNSNTKDNKCSCENVVLAENSCCIR